MLMKLIDVSKSLLNAAVNILGLLYSTQLGAPAYYGSVSSGGMASQINNLCRCIYAHRDTHRPA